MWFLEVALVSFLLVGITALKSAHINEVNCENTICTELEKCETIKHTLTSTHDSLQPQLLKFLKTQICGFYDNKPKICCPNSIENSKKNIKNWLNVTADSERQVICKHSFQCLDLLACSPLLYLMELGKPMANIVEKLIKTQQCGFYGGQLKVCCKLANNTSEDGLNAIATTTTTESTEERRKTVEKKFLNRVMEEYYFHDVMFDFMDFDLFRRKRDNRFGLNFAEIEIR